MRRLLALTLAIAGLLAPAAASARYGGKVYVDGRLAAAKPAAIERHGRTYVPLRGVLQRLGASVAYERPNAVLVVRNAEKLMRLTIGSKIATIRGVPKFVGVAPFRSKGRIYVPLRLVGEVTGATVAYRSNPRRIDIRSAHTYGVRAAAPTAVLVPPTVPAPVLAGHEQPRRSLAVVLGALLAALAVAFGLAYLFWRARALDDPVVITRTAL